MDLQVKTKISRFRSTPEAKTHYVDLSTAEAGPLAPRQVLHLDCRWLQAERMESSVAMPADQPCAFFGAGLTGALGKAVVKQGACGGVLSVECHHARHLSMAGQRLRV